MTYFDKVKIMGKFSDRKLSEPFYKYKYPN